MLDELLINSWHFNDLCKWDDFAEPLDVGGLINLLLCI